MIITTQFISAALCATALGALLMTFGAASSILRAGSFFVAVLCVLCAWRVWTAREARLLFLCCVVLAIALSAQSLFRETPEVPLPVTLLGLAAAVAVAWRCFLVLASRSKG